MRPIRRLLLRRAIGFRGVRVGAFLVGFVFVASAANASSTTVPSTTVPTTKAPVTTVAPTTQPLGSAVACQRTTVLSATEQQWQGRGVKRVQHRYGIAGKNGFWFVSGMTIDADGSPHAFHRISSRGLDDLANAGHPGNWWGILTDNGETTGRPIVQTKTDPAPGFYISQTGLEDTSKKERDPRRYVDAERVPYVVLSGTNRQNLRAKFGDYIVVYNKANSKYAYAIYGDNWPTLKIGEGSIALAK